MIKSICRFITGEVTKTNQTNATVYLSDGTHWKASKFHQHVNLIRSFMQLEVQSDPQLQEIREEVNRSIDILKSRKLVLAREVEEVQKLQDSRNKTLDQLLGEPMNTVFLGFGQYKGQKLLDVRKADPDYLGYIICKYTLQVRGNELRAYNKY